MENYTDKAEQELIRTNALPVIPLRGKVAFPHTSIAFEVGRETTLKAVERAGATSDKQVLICTQKDTDKDDVTPDDVYSVGCVARIKQIAQLPGGAIRVVCEGLYRAKARYVRLENGCFYAVADELPSRFGEENLQEAYFRTAKALVKDVLSADGKISKEVSVKLERTNDPDAYVDICAYSMRVKLEIKQKLLEETDVIKRLQIFERCLNDELEISRIEKKIATAVRQNIDKSQKEYYLREQLKAIHTELGDENKEENEYREKFFLKMLPDGLEKKCLKEIDRMSRMQPSSPEYSVITTYLDQVLELPFEEETRDTQSIAKCAEILNEDHYGLEKVKERITEYLAVLKLKENMKAPILCLVGPPGVGKTSIAKSIARALGREFVRMSLGGVKDEAEIRGHRRTYIGAMPGRILYGMKNAGRINPVFLLDEIDKITSDMHGDPAAALLEALDPEQNSTFRDRYLEYPYDLSKVLFVTTANSLETIPAPLRDRMEILEISGYTPEEKTEIARRYLIPKQLEANGLTSKNAEFTEAGIRTVIEGYTREAGVRTLERTIGAICRKIAVEYADNQEMDKVKVTVAEVKKRLGAPRFKIDTALLKPQVGAVTGLAWTAVGGTTLTVEATKYAGKGEIKLTGHLGDVMKESAHAALTYLRAHAEEYGIENKLFTENDLHVHVPEGATPKDGPSAGVTIATALFSALTGKPVRGDVAMTGEITLRGKVLPIGGLKEKALASRRVGIKTVIIPEGNVKDLEELPQALKEDVTFLPVSEIGEVLASAIAEKVNEKPNKNKRKIKPLPVLPQNQADAGDSVRCK